LVSEKLPGNNANFAGPLEMVWFDNPTGCENYIPCSSIPVNPPQYPIILRSGPYPLKEFNLYCQGSQYQNTDLPNQNNTICKNDTIKTTQKTMFPTYAYQEYSLLSNITFETFASLQPTSIQTLQSSNITFETFESIQPTSMPTLRETFYSSTKSTGKDDTLQYQFTQKLAQVMKTSLGLICSLLIIVVIKASRDLCIRN